LPPHSFPPSIVRIISATVDAHITQASNDDVVQLASSTVPAGSIRFEELEFCHGVLATYSVDDVLRFLAETESEILVLEVRTEFGHEDPPDLGEYLVERLGEHLIPQDEAVFHMTLAELLPRRVLCVWKPGELLWSVEHLRDDWINTDLPETKFKSNLEQPTGRTCTGWRTR
jgi:hypothetical protein